MYKGITYTFIRDSLQNQSTCLSFMKNQTVETESGVAYCWCVLCERTYQRNAVLAGYQFCPYGDCDGNAGLTARDWNEIREMHSDYPAAPVNGKIYPLA